MIETGTAKLVSGALQVERLPTGRRWLMRALILETDPHIGERSHSFDGFKWIPNGTRVTVPTGFETDYSSIPFFARALYRFSRVDLAGVAHDYAYAVGIPRSEADRLWRMVAASGAHRVTPAKAWIGWAGLRLGGWWAYRQHARTRQGR